MPTIFRAYEQNERKTALAVRLSEFCEVSRKS